MHRIILIGLRATGKSSIGREVARMVGGSFLDLDDAVAAASGACSVQDAFMALGEQAFRAVEAAALIGRLDLARITRADRAHPVGKEDAALHKIHL